MFWQGVFRANRFSGLKRPVRHWPVGFRQKRLAKETGYFQAVGDTAYCLYKRVKAILPSHLLATISAHRFISHVDRVAKWWQSVTC